MKRILFILLLIPAFYAQAQVYNNEWIDYSKTYYKFKIGSTGLYRISQSTLSSLGLGSTPVQDFQLWRNGKEIPIYTSVQSGSLGASDYIEFWALRNDGIPDNALYRITDHQLNETRSLQTDTVAFFLTVNPGGTNLRLVPAINDVPGNILPPEPFFIHMVGNQYVNQKINPGYAAVVGDYVYSSNYDAGEGWSTTDIGTGVTRDDQQNNLFVYTGAGAPIPWFKFHASGNALNPRNILVKINGDTVLFQGMDFFDYVKTTVPVPLSLISSGTALIQMKNACVTPNDRIVVAKNELYYPRLFNFNGAANFSFSLPANPAGNYLEISNFNYNGIPPVLYDITNGKRYVADITNPALVRIALQPSATERILVLVSEDAAAIGNITTLQIRNFVNFTIPSSQGNYIIITHPVLNTASDNSNPVDEYRLYRNSAAGGNFNVKVYWIDELVDQFGFGIKMHPLSVRNFIRWARANFASSLKNIFLIGKGVTYNQFRANESHVNMPKLNFIPTFGWPASDNLLSAEPGNEIPQTPIGRLSVISGDEVKAYLNKVKQYEQAQAFSSPLLAEKAWMKNVVHIIGSSNPALENILVGFMNRYKTVIKDTFFGGNVSTFSKNSADAVQQIGGNQVYQLFNTGISLLTYFGHSSSTTLEFNLDNPENYNNPGKYPVMVALGCNAGNFFNFNSTRLQVRETLSERFVLAPERGTISFIASTSLGIVQYLDLLNSAYYDAITRSKYGKSLGEIMEETINEVFNLTTQNDFYARLHCEQITLNGDPALKINTTDKPDYVVEDPNIKISPSFISVAETQFKVNATLINKGKATGGKIVVELKRTFPDLSTAVIKRDTIPGIRYLDSLTYNIPISPTRDKGLNKITITVDADNEVDELYESNNTVTREVYVFEDEARPVYPYNFSILSQQNIKFMASTANVFAQPKQYRMELDTTELFNSPFKVSQNITSAGGVLEFAPTVTFTDNTVYYWRVAPVPASASFNWNTSSFIFIAGSDAGYNQSHYFQHDKSRVSRMLLNQQGRNWVYDSIRNNLFIKNGVFGSATNQEGDIIVSVNGDAYIRSACVGYSLIFNLFNPKNIVPNINLFGAYGSAPMCAPSRKWNYEFSYMTPASRKTIMDFMDSIPDGYFVTVRSINNINQPAGGWVHDWKNDTLLYGSGNSLYHKLINAGFTQIDSFYRVRSIAFIYQKNNNNFIPKSSVSNGPYDIITLNQDLKSPDTLGYITSPVFGPAKAWKQLSWRGNADPSPGDSVTLSVIGIRNDGMENILYNGLNLTQQDYDVSSINAVTYPFVKLQLRTSDRVHYTPYQLSYWRLTYDPVPEGTIAPNLFFSAKDAVDVGEPYEFKVAFKNISNVAFDSVKVKMIITDKNNVQNIIPVPRRRPIPASGTPNDTLVVGGTVNSAGFTGTNTVYIEVNPDNDQPEQYHFNNFVYRNLYVKPDSLQPLLDVTFDGVHILNRDMVSSKPAIVIKLKDEAKWMALDDTSLMKIQVRDPDGNLHRYFFNNDTLQFIPAGLPPLNDNTATVHFLPYFSRDGEYELIISGKDKSDNTAGNLEYRVTFQVINKPMISNLLNYPNPFTTSTAFVFYITGNEVPQQIKIEIMTVTGKVVREITKNELGPLHIGRNITEFKWDGTDQYGQKLANGIYLYRVVTNLNGKSLEKYKAPGDETDKYFNKGYGKMYLMR